MIAARVRTKKVNGCRDPALILLDVDVRVSVAVGPDEPVSLVTGTEVPVAVCKVVETLIEASSSCAQASIKRLPIPSGPTLMV